VETDMDVDISLEQRCQTELETRGVCFHTGL